MTPSLSPPRIVVLDGKTLNPGDLGWEALEQLGTCVIHDRTPPELVVERAAGAQILLTNKTPVTAGDIAQLSSLAYIGVLATGFNIVDVEAARRQGIPVTNVPAYSTMAVAQLVFAHLFNLTHRIGHHTRAVAGGRWSSSPDFSFWDFPLLEIDGLTMGILGFGRIGGAVARVARAFGMNVLAHGPGSGGGGDAGVQHVGLDELFKAGDVVTLHCPLTDETRGLVNASRLASMKRSALLINTSRGPLIDEPALAGALAGGIIAGAGLDVLSVEPPPSDHPLLRAPNCFITPHIAWATTAARRRLMAGVAANIQAFLAGQPVNVVNPRKGGRDGRKI
jgi:glycerate dehydrogenase